MPTTRATSRPKAALSQAALLNCQNASSFPARLRNGAAIVSRMKQGARKRYRPSKKTSVSIGCT
jgi:hypothetical protein